MPYSRSNMAKFERHMATDHSVFFGMEYLLAGCKMTDEERHAVTDVVTEKEGGSGGARITRVEESRSSGPATLEEGEVNHQEDEAEVDPLENVETTVSRATIKREMSSQRPYKCNHCPKSFTLSDNLDEHMTRRHPNMVSKSSKKSKKLSRGFQRDVKPVLVQRRKSTSTPKRHGQDIPEGEGFPCTECGNVYKTEAMQKFHYTDVHVQGHYPCKGNCGKIFTSKNKMSSHWSRNCNNKKKRNSL